MSTFQGRNTRSLLLGDFITLLLKATFTLSLLLSVSIISLVALASDKRKSSPRPRRVLSRAELRQAEAKLSEMGYVTGRVDGVIDADTRTALIAFQKWERRKVTGNLNRADFDSIMSAAPPRIRDTGYKDVEIDLDRQVLLLTDDDGQVTRVLPISSGSNKHYKEKTMSGLAYTPRGRFRIESKIADWRKSPLGLLYYPSYFSGGLAIHGNPSVPHDPQSHGCIRIPMSAAIDISRQLPVGTIVLIYDKQSFVSAKDWVAADKQKQEATIR